MKKQITIDVDYKDLLLSCCTKIDNGDSIDTDYYTCKGLEGCIEEYFKDKLDLSLNEETVEEMAKEINDQYFNFSVIGEYSYTYYYMIDGDLYILPRGEL